MHAINIDTKKTVWMARQRAPMSTGVLATAGGVVFAGAIDRSFSAYDDATGKELWRTRLNDVPSSAPITYVVNGRQYLALVTGNGGAQAATFPALTPEIKNPPDRGATLWVFELPTVSTAESVIAAHRRFLARACAAAIALAVCGLTPTAQTAPVHGIYNWIHSTGDAERAFAFYHDVFGIELARSPFAGARLVRRARTHPSRGAGGFRSARLGSH